MTENLQSHAKNGKATQDVVENAFSLLKGVLGYDSFEDVDLVIEVSDNWEHIYHFKFLSLLTFSYCHFYLTRSLFNCCMSMLKIIYNSS